MDKDKLQAQIEAVNNLANKYSDNLTSHTASEIYHKIFCDMQKGDVASKYTIALMYEDGSTHTGQNLTQSYRLFQSAAHKGHRGAQYMYGNMHEEDKDYVNAVYWWEKAAKQGCFVSQAKVAKAYYFGTGVKEDEEQAMYWYSQSTKTNLGLSDKTLEHDNLALIKYNEELIDTVKGLIKDKKKLMEDNTKLMEGKHNGK